MKPGANAAAESVAQAFTDPDLGHRLTSMIPAPDFDRAAYENDPQAYLDTIEPGRIWQSLADSPNVTPLQRTSDYFYEVLQGEKIQLEVKAEKLMPVSFYSPKLGQFESGLSVTTVRADEDGIARASFLASAGTRGEIDILASSPVHSGQVRYLVNVIVPSAGRAGPSVSDK